MHERTISNAQFAMILGVCAVLFFLTLLPLELIPEIPVDIDQKPFFIPLIFAALLPFGRPTLAVGLGVALGEGLRDLMEGYELDDPFGFIGYIVAFVLAGLVISARPLNRGMLAVGAVLCGAVQAAFEAATFLLFGKESVPVAITSWVGNTITHGVLWGALPLMYFAPKMHGRFERFLGFAPKGAPSPKEPLRPGDTLRDPDSEPGALVRVRGLAFRYPGTERAALVDVSLCVRAGEIVGVLGPSGSGKSTLCAVLAGLAPRSTGGELAGRVLVDDVDPAADTAERAGSAVLMTGEAAAHLTQVRARDEVAAVLMNRGVDLNRAHARANELLQRVGLQPAVATRYTWTLSEGEQRCVGLAAALAADPKLYIFDEFGAGLDPGAQRRLLELIREESHRRGRAVIWVDTDSDRLLDFADRIALIGEGKTIVQSTPREVFGQRELLERWGLEQPLKIDTEQCVERAPAALLRRPVLVQRTSDAPGPGGRGEREPLLVLEDLSFGYDEAQSIFTSLHYAISTEPRVAAIVGADGTGKTTLARLITGLAKPQRGRVMLRGKDVTALRAVERLGSVAFAVRNADQSLSEATVRKELLFPLEHARAARADADKRLREVIALAGLPHEILDRDPAQLPAGLRKRVQIAALLTLGAKLLILDEPAAYLDASERRSLATWIRSMPARGLSILVLDHDVDFVVEIADRVAVLGDGRIVNDASFEDAFAPQCWPQLEQRGLASPRTAQIAATLGLQTTRREELRRQLAANM